MPLLQRKCLHYVVSHFSNHLRIINAVLIKRLPSNYFEESFRFLGYQINPKPCWVDGQEGTCMFVYECIKSNGYHIGMCVDAFMFGSCCTRNSSDNAVQASTGQIVKPQVLYTPPSHTHNSHSQVTKKPVKITSLSYYSNNQLRPTR